MPRFRLDCRICTKNQKRNRGCEGKPAQPFSLEVDGKKEELSLCPVNLITMDTIKMMRYHRFYKEGFLPSPGAIVQQSPAILDAFEIINNEIAKIKEQEKNAPRHK